ncbi:MAG: UDP-N-acetylmuramate dehydrogenase [Monoglobales bacterium]
MIDCIKKITSAKNILINEPMSRHTTFKIGGNADYYITPESVDELAGILRQLKEHSVPHMVVGNGSNLLVSDDGIEGAVISTEKITNITVTGNEIYADAGAKLSALASEATKNSLSGLEFAAGIPGSVGGGIYMNAGAYDGELKDTINFVRIIREGEIVDLPCEKCNFGYRSSIFQSSGDIIIGASFSLTPGDYSEIIAKVHDLSARRKQKQPLEFPSAGSIFKRPEGHFAGKLIQDCGLKGFSIGGAQISDKHCGFIINKGGATAKDVTELIKYIKTEVYVKFGVKIQEEIKLIGRR